MKYLVMIVALLVLPGCASEVDKCVDAGMKSTINENPDITKENKDRSEWLHRMDCLKAQSGK